MIPDFAPTRLPDKLRLKRLADDNDLVKLNRVLWRGVNHPGEPPDDSLRGRKRMQSGPHSRKALAMVIEAPNGDGVRVGRKRVARLMRQVGLEEVSRRHGRKTTIHDTNTAPPAGTLGG